MAFAPSSISTKIIPGFDPAGEQVTTLALTFYNRVALSTLVDGVAEAIRAAVREYIAKDASIHLAIADEIKAASAIVPVDAIRQAVKEAIADQTKDDGNPRT